MTAKVVDIGGKPHIHGRPVTRFFCNGCGTTWTRRIIRDNLPFLPMREICCAHDYAYVRGGSEEDRREADAFFRESILSFQQGRCCLVRWYIRRVANLRWWAVHEFGDNGSFEYTRTGQPREPIHVGEEVYFYDDERIGFAA